MITSTTGSGSKFKTMQPWLVCIAASLFFFYEFVQMSMFNAINPSLIRDFSVSATQLGSLSAAYFYANILFMLPAGLLLDRYSTKLIILTAMLTCVIGTVCFSLTDSLYTAMICRFLTGIGGSFPFLCCLRLAIRWFPPKKLGLITGIMITMAMLGGVVAQTPLTLLTINYGWRASILIDGLLGIIFMLIIYFVVHNEPASNIQKTVTKHINKLPVMQSLKRITSNKQNWLFGIYTCMLNLPIFLLAQTWGSLYLSQVHHLSMTKATMVTSMIFIGTILGSPTLGWLSDTISRRKLPMLLGAIVSLAIILLIMYLPSLSFTSLLLLFLALGYTTSTQIITYPAISESNSLVTNSGALGLASILIMSGGAIFEPMFGWLMQRNWSHEVIDGIPNYSSADYHHAFMILPVAFVVGIIVMFFAKETFCRKLKSDEN
jgi:MFS family permease